MLHVTGCRLKVDCSSCQRANVSTCQRVNVPTCQQYVQNEEEVSYDYQNSECMELSGAQIINRYYDVNEKTQYSLSVLDLNAFKDQVTQMKELSQQAQEAIRQNADAAFEELEQEAAKEEGR